MVTAGQGAHVVLGSAYRQRGHAIARVYGKGIYLAANIVIVPGGVGICNACWATLVAGMQVAVASNNHEDHERMRSTR
jgi:hypothetical protein